MSTRHSKKNSSSQSHRAVSHGAHPAHPAHAGGPKPVGGAHALPEVGAPAPPADAGGAKAPRVNVLTAQVDIALEAARELRASGAFGGIVGARITTGDKLANALEFAVAWHRQKAAAKAWLA